MLLPTCVLLLCITMSALGDPSGPITSHFLNWLKERHTYFKYAIDMVETHGSQGSFGGKANDRDDILHMPIIFLHGNSDGALDNGEEWSTGWSTQIAYLMEHGYKPSELYAPTFGTRNISSSFQYSFNCKDVVGLRRFFEAVIEYTDAKKIKVVGHGIGVSFARKIIQGGLLSLPNEVCDIGKPLSAQIDTFLGIAGANYGICTCELFHMLPACDRKAGMYPGGCGIEYAAQGTCSQPMIKPPCDDIHYGSVLEELNKSGIEEADHIISFWSDGDELLGSSNSVWGRQTSLIPYSESHRIFHHVNHQQVKTFTFKEQAHILRRTYF